MGRREGPTLAERSAAGRAVDGPVGAVDRPRPAGRRHCWVTGRAAHPGRWPGLLVEWRRGPGAAPGWEGRVVYVVGLPSGRALLVEDWVPAAELEQA